MATSSTESFDQTTVQDLAPGKSFKTGKGLTITISDIPNGETDGWARIRAVATKDNPDKKELLIYGNTEVSIKFGKKIKDLCIDYCMSLSPDAPSGIKVEDFDEAVILGLNTGSDGSAYEVSSSSTATTFDLNQAPPRLYKEPFDKMVIRMAEGVRIHIDALRWNDA